METSLIIAARDELVSRLQYMFSLPVYRYFASMWYESRQTAAKELGSRNASVEAIRDIFLVRLNSVKHWTSTQISEQYINVTQSKEGLFELLLTRTFSLSSRILVFAVDIPPAFLRISIPDNRRFVHAVFINAARAFYRNPWLFAHNYRDQNPYSQIILLEKTIDDVVLRTVRELMNVDNIFHPPSVQPPTVDSSDYNAPSFSNNEVQQPQPQSLDVATDDNTAPIANDELVSDEEGDGGEDVPSEDAMKSDIRVV